MNRFAALLVAMLLCPLPTQAAPVVADISTYRIDIDAGFNGIRMFLFGARSHEGDIIAVIRGPSKNYIVRKKEKIAGIWINRQRMKFFNVPNFYYIASAKKMDEQLQNSVMQQLGIGQENLLSPPPDPRRFEEFKQFSAAFLRQQQAEGRYAADVAQIEFMGETLFKTVAEFPNNIPPGTYTAEFYLISDGQVVGMQSTPINVVKTGLDAFIYNAAHKYPALYGIGAIAVALAAGWAASRLFKPN